MKSRNIKEVITNIVADYCDGTHKMEGEELILDLSDATFIDSWDYDTYAPSVMVSELIEAIGGTMRRALLCCQDGDYVMAAHILGEALKEV